MLRFCIPWKRDIGRIWVYKPERSEGLYKHKRCKNKIESFTENFSAALQTEPALLSTENLLQ